MIITKIKLFLITDNVLKYIYDLYKITSLSPTLNTAFSQNIFFFFTKLSFLFFIANVYVNLALTQPFLTNLIMKTTSY